MSTKLYYEAPSDAIFDQMKQACIETWISLHGKAAGGYIEEKLEYINSIQNIRENFMTLFAMLDVNGQREVVSRLPWTARYALKNRLKSVDWPESEADLAALGLE